MRSYLGKQISLNMRSTKTQCRKRAFSYNGNEHRSRKCKIFIQWEKFKSPEGIDPEVKVEGSLNCKNGFPGTSRVCPSGDLTKTDRILAGGGSLSSDPAVLNCCPENRVPNSILEIPYKFYDTCVQNICSFD